MLSFVGGIDKIQFSHQIAIILILHIFILNPYINRYYNQNENVEFLALPQLLPTDPTDLREVK